MRRRLTRIVARRRSAEEDLDAALPEAVRVLDVLEVARLVGMTPPGLYKRLDRLGVQRPKRGKRPEGTTE